MPVNLGSCLARCPACGWTTPVQTQGDVIFSAPRSCPRCGNSSLVIKRANGVSALADSVLNGFKKLINSR